MYEVVDLLCEYEKVAMVIDEQTKIYLVFHTCDIMMMYHQYSGL
jgi:hypothetical protein